MSRFITARRAALLASALAIPLACGDDGPTQPRSVAFTTALSGAAERPPVSTAATGSATVTVAGAQASYTVAFSGLSGAPTAAHIHGAGDANSVSTVLVPIATTGATTGTGTLTGTFTAADIVPAAGQTAAISFDSLTTLMRAGLTYVNVHTSARPGGEIRGQLARQQPGGR